MKIDEFNEWLPMTVDLAIEVLKDPNRDICYGTSYTESAIKIAIQALEAQRWISVSERLPTEKDANSSLEVLVWDQASCWHDLLGYGSVEDNDHITHWMPFPEEPSEVE